MPPAGNGEEPGRTYGPAGLSADCSRASKSTVRVPPHSNRRLSETLAVTFSLSLHFAISFYTVQNFAPVVKGLF